MQTTPKRLILELMSTLPRDGESSMPVRALLEAGGLFGFAENRVRVALARLVANGEVRSDERGRYRPGPSAEPVWNQVRGWRRLEERRVGWDGGWVGVHGRISGRGVARERSERALRLLGLQPFAPDLQLRPDNLSGGVADLRVRLHGLGIDPSACVMRISGLDRVDDERARALWDATALEAAHRRMISELEESQDRLSAQAPEAGMVESFLVGRRGIGQLVLDPLLPEALCSGSARRALARTVAAYDAFGRRCWAPWRERHGIKERRPAGEPTAFELELNAAATSG